tara:strand:- start:1398 stop:1763 length:366 start_codon:yes stop_codon:yes gene_type:complete
MESRREAAAKEGLEKIKTFLRDNGIKLTMSSGEENYLDHAEGEIVVSSAQSSENVLYTILHEVGHYFLETEFYSNTRIGLLVAEVLAWDRGHDVAAVLQIDIHHEAWQALMESCLSEYLQQ